MYFESNIVDAINVFTLSLRARRAWQSVLRVIASEARQSPRKK